MIISIIAAMDEKRGIGINGQIPWRLKDDLKQFKRFTMGHYLIVGRKTFESIGKPLPGREIIVLTKERSYSPSGCSIAHSIDEALSIARFNGEYEVFVIGGGEIFRQFLELSSRLYLTIVHTFVQADTYFPEFSNGDWVLKWECYHPKDENNQYSFTFMYLERNKMTSGIQ